MSRTPDSRYEAMIERQDMLEGDDRLPKKSETTNTEQDEKHLIKEAIRILDLSEGAHRRFTPEGKQAFRDALWKMPTDTRTFVGRLYDFGKEFHGTDDQVLKYWDENKENIVDAGMHMVPHLLHDPMVEIYIVRALGILEAEGVLRGTGVKKS